MDCNRWSSNRINTRQIFKEEPRQRKLTRKERTFNPPNHLITMEILLMILETVVEAYTSMRRGATALARADECGFPKHHPEYPQPRARSR